MSVAFFFTTVHTFSNNVDEVLDKDIQLKLNGKAIDQKLGITQSDITEKEENKLMIEVKPKTFDAGEKLKLEVIMARGRRPIAKTQTSFSGQVVIDLSHLLRHAKPGDRIVLAFNDDERIMVIPIS